MSVAIHGALTNNQAEVTSNKELQIRPTLTDANAGFVVTACESDAGSITGTRVVRVMDVSGDYRTRVGIDSLAFNEQFPGTIVNTKIWQAPVTTMTVTMVDGFIILNAGNSIAAGAVAQVASKQLFPIYGTFGISVEQLVSFAFLPVQGNIIRWGFGIVSGAANPTDGCYFEVDDLGVFRGVSMVNGTAQHTAPIDFATIVDANKTVHTIVLVTEDSVEFWIHDVIVGTIPRAANGPSMTQSGRAPVFMHNWNTVGVGQAQQIRCGLANVQLLDLGPVKLWNHTRCSAGGMGDQVQTGTAVGMTPNYANSANPAPAVATNTTAALGTGLGGQFWETDTFAVTNDGIICSYQVPIASATLPGNQLVVHGIWIDSYIQTTLTGGGYNAQWTLAYGHSTVSLATVDATTTKAPVRKALGCQTVAVNAAALTMLARIQIQFQNPIVVNPGEFIAVVRKKVGTAPSAGVIAHVIGFDSYWD